MWGAENDHLGILGAPLDFWGLGVLWESILGVWRCPWAPSARNGLQSPWSLLASPHFNRFWRPKGAQKAPKMELKSAKNGVKHRSTFLFDFSSVSEAFFMIFGRFLRHWTFKNGLLV